MAHRKTERNPLFARRWFEDDIILLCLRWYFRFKLSYRDLVAILGERGLSISHTTILRWVIRYAETCEKRWGRFQRPVDGSWRVDETFIKVRGSGSGSTYSEFASSRRTQRGALPSDCRREAPRISSREISGPNLLLPIVAIRKIPPGRRESNMLRRTNRSSFLSSKYPNDGIVRGKRLSPTQARFPLTMPFPLPRWFAIASKICSQGLRYP